jgi:hypothetical protein
MGGESIKPVEMKTEDVVGLLERIKPLVPKEDMELLNALVETLTTLTRLIRERGSTIARLRSLLGFRSSEKTADVLNKQEKSAGQDQDGQDQDGSKERQLNRYRRGE